MRSFAWAALALVLSACSDDSDDDRRIWHDDSVGIDFVLRNLGQTRCEFSATREELSEAQLEGLAALSLVDAQLRGGCDGMTYAVTIRNADGSSANYSATRVDCADSRILLFEDFDAWAQSTPCSSEPEG